MKLYFAVDEKTFDKIKYNFGHCVTFNIVEPLTGDDNFAIGKICSIKYDTITGTKVVICIEDNNTADRLYLFNNGIANCFKDDYKFTIGLSDYEEGAEYCYETATELAEKERSKMKTYYFFVKKCLVEDYIHITNKVFGNLSIIAYNWAGNAVATYFPISVVSDCSCDSYNTYKIDYLEENLHVSKNCVGAYELQIYKSLNDAPKDYIKIWLFESYEELDKYIKKVLNEYRQKRMDYIDALTYSYPRRVSFDPVNDRPVLYNQREVDATFSLWKMNITPGIHSVIKDIKVNGPATIVFWDNETKTIVKCQSADEFDIEKGIIMALCKGYQGNAKHWTDLFDIPYADEIDVEKTIGLAYIRRLKGADKNWYYNYILKWVYKIKGYKFEDEVAALKAHGYSDERIMKCLNTTKGKVREALGQGLVYKKEQKIPAVAKSNDKFIDSIKFPSGDEYKFAVNKEETKKVLKDIIQEDSLSEKVIKMFNDGTKIAKIAKSLGISEYFVKKALDEATKPKANPKKVDKILKKAKKEKTPHKKHVLRTEIEFPDYLEKEECEKILAATKLKYASNPRVNCMSELQKFFIRECKIYKIRQLYGKNGYSMYEIAQIIGTTAAGVQKMYNAHKEEIESQGE